MIMSPIQKTQIFIIDDNEAVCEALKFSFDCVFNSVKISLYFDPLIFLDQFSPNWTGCLILDLFMPSLNGLDFLKEIKKRKSAMHVIVMSGHGTKEAAARSLKEGACAFFYKPLKMELLLEKVDAILRMPPRSIF